MLLGTGCRFDGGGVAPRPPSSDRGGVLTNDGGDRDARKGTFDGLADGRRDLDKDTPSEGGRVDLPSEDGSSCPWPYRRKLTFQAVSFQTPLVDVPILVVLKASRFDYANTTSDGRDLRFVDADGVTVLPHEIEHWDPAGASYVWVRVPQIDPTSTSDFIWMYYGKVGPSLPSPPPGTGPSEVWTSHFLAVWHMNDDPSATAPQISDSSKPATDLTTMVTTPKASRVQAMVGEGLALNGTSQYLTGALPTSVAAPKAFTYEAWIKLNEVGDEEHHIVALDKTQFFVEKDSSPQFPGPGRKLEFGSNDEFNANGTTQLKVQTWYFVTLVHQAQGTWQIFLNGNLENHGEHSVTPKRTIFVGRIYFSKPQHPTYLHGIIDEVRISSVARSGDWINAQHLSMTDHLLSYGPEQATSPAACLP